MTARAGKKRVVIPEPSNPPHVVEVQWVDANWDATHEGPSKDYDGELLVCPQSGYHVKNGKDSRGNRVVVLAGSAWVEEGVVQSRFHMTIPAVHVISFKIATLEGRK